MESTTERKSPRPWLWLGVFVVGLVLFLALDETIYRLVHENYNYHTRPVPTHLKLVTRILRSMEDWGENVYVLAVLVAMWRLDPSRRSRVLCVVLSAILVSVAAEGVKRSTGRERPEVSAGRLVFHGPSKWNEGGDYQSFPSGHTAAAASYSGSLATFYPPIRPVCVALMVGCASNRIWKERHFASDCWVSLFLGYWFAGVFASAAWTKPLRDAFDRRFSQSDGSSPTSEAEPRLAA